MIRHPCLPSWLTKYHLSFGSIRLDNTQRGVWFARACVYSAERSIDSWRHADNNNWLNAVPVLHRLDTPGSQWTIGETMPIEGFYRLARTNSFSVYLVRSWESDLRLRGTILYLSPWYRKTQVNTYAFLLEPHLATSRARSPVPRKLKRWIARLARLPDRSRARGPFHP